METLRLSEWSKARVNWPPARRQAIAEAAENWRVEHRLNALPLEWSGSDGCTLQTRQWVGVVEVDGARIEIYPKTDKRLLQCAEYSESEARDTLRVLLRMLEAANFPHWNATGDAVFSSGALSFVDMWAQLFASHLRDELRLGLPHDYLAHEDDLYAVRGRIFLPRQLARYGDRVDTIACRWDGFSPDTALLRLLKCSTKVLSRRATHPATLGLLSDCLLMLDEVSDCTPAEALTQNERPIWTRAQQRFRPHFDLASWILRELGPQISSGSQRIWTFLVDMNAVFEAFVGAALRDRFGNVEEQKHLGHLITAPQVLHRQIPDFVWHDGAGVCIGDAKWKLFRKADKDDEAADEVGLSVNPADIRQLTTYAELHCRHHAAPPRDLFLFYPSLSTQAAPIQWQTWNDLALHIVPVQLHGWQRPQEAFRFHHPSDEKRLSVRTGVMSHSATP